jgi:hypothetical protein
MDEFEFPSNDEETSTLQAKLIVQGKLNSNNNAVTIDWIKSAVKVDVLKAPLKNDDVCSPVHHLWPKLK